MEMSDRAENRSGSGFLSLTSRMSDRITSLQDAGRGELNRAPYQQATFYLSLTLIPFRVSDRMSDRSGCER